MTQAQSKIAARIRALLAKTTANGCTEAEALAAAQMAADMMDRHGFDDQDIEEKEAITEETYFFKGRRLGPIAFVSPAISRYCDVKSWSATVDGVVVIRQFGRESDVALAQYLVHLFCNAFETEWHRYFNREVAPIPPARRPHGRTIRSAFDAGMVNRVIERLDEMKKARDGKVDAATGKTGRDLVLVKSREVELAFKARTLGLNLRASSSSRTIRSATAFQAGKDAGGRINITTGISGNRLALPGR